MHSSTPFAFQMANLVVEVGGFNNEDSACLQGLKGIFIHHEVDSDTKAMHRITVCAPETFKIPREATLRWQSACLGIAGKKHRRCLWDFFRKKEIPQYSGTGKVLCYSDEQRKIDYYVPENGEWRIEHHVEEHVTNVYSDQPCETSDGLPSMLVHIIGSQYGCYLLYASSIAIDGKALLFMGNGGVGKTTLCRELIRQGATYLGDDLVLLYRQGEQTMAGSLLFPLKYFADKQQDRKRKMDMVPQLPQRPPLSAPLASAYLLQRRNANIAEPRLELIPSEAMFETTLMLTNKAHTHADARHFVATLSTICERVPFYSLCYNDSSKLTPSFFSRP